MYFPGLLNWIVAMSVVFTNTFFTFLRLFIKAVYKGGVPVAIHDSRWRGNAPTSEPGYLIFGETMILTTINRLLFISLIEHLAFYFFIHPALCLVINLQLSKTAAWIWQKAGESMAIFLSYFRLSSVHLQLTTDGTKWNFRVAARNAFYFLFNMYHALTISISCWRGLLKIVSPDNQLVKLLYLLDKLFGYVFFI